MTANDTRNPTVPTPGDDKDEHAQWTSPSRRGFIQQAAVLSLAIPTVGAALSGCEKSSPQGQPSGAPEGSTFNPDSSLDEPDEIHEKSDAAGMPTAQGVEYHRFDPTLGPPPEDGVLRLDWRAVNAPIRILPKVVVGAWTFEGDMPAPTLHCRVGDTVDFKFTNETTMPHSMDFHAAQIDPKVAFRSVGHGESVSFSFTPRHAGAFLYHCGTAPVLMHIGTGMFGALIVSPREPLPPAKEFVLIQSELYLDAADSSGIYPFSYLKMLNALSPQYLAFNGRPNQYSREPIRVKKGDRVRFWVVNAGPTLPCVFHIVGEQFETVYLGEPPNSAIHGVQSYSVGAGGGMGFELVCDIPGDFVCVNHAFGHGQKGAIGHLVVEE